MHNNCWKENYFKIENLISEKKSKSLVQQTLATQGVSRNLINQFIASATAFMSNSSSSTSSLSELSESNHIITTSMFPFYAFLPSHLSIQKSPKVWSPSSCTVSSDQKRGES